MLSLLGHCREVTFPTGKMLIGGQWVEGLSGQTWTHRNPATDERIRDVCSGEEADVDQAVGAARRAFDEGRWATLKGRERQSMLRDVARLIYENQDELDKLQVFDNAMPMSMAKGYVVSAAMAADIFYYHSGWIDKLTGDIYPEFRELDVLSLGWREPVGVVAAVVAWNAPLFLFAQKVAPALAAGCTVVVKPSEFGSLSVLRLAELISAADLPIGVLNVVTGPGDVTGEALVTHPLVDKVTFTGSRAVGQRILTRSGRDIKRVSLELGGKSPSINFADVDPTEAATVAIRNVAMGLSGQGCVCQTRALVERPIYEEFIAAAIKAAESVKFGDPFQADTTSGPLINNRQVKRVTDYIEGGKRSSATLALGGDRPGGELSAGNWVNPTLFVDVDNQNALAQEEIFGPVLCVIPFRGEDEAVRIANATSYGLGAGIFTNDLQKGIRIAKRVRAGQIGVNGTALAPATPYGGFKTSGLGREGGLPGLEEFTERKTVWLRYGPNATDEPPSVTPGDGSL